MYISFVFLVELFKTVDSDAQEIKVSTMEKINFGVK